MATSPSPTCPPHVIKVNACGGEELMLIPGVGVEVAARLLAVRREGTSITPSILAAVLRSTPSAATWDRLDFTPGHPTPDAEGDDDLSDCSSSDPPNTLDQTVVDRSSASGRPALTTVINPALGNPWAPKTVPRLTPREHQKWESHPCAPKEEPDTDFDRFSVSQLPQPPTHFTTRHDCDRYQQLDTALSQALQSIAELRGEPGVREYHAPAKPAGNQRARQIAVSSSDNSSDDTDSDNTDRTSIRRRRACRTGARQDPYSVLRNLPRGMVYNGKSDWQAFALKFSRYAEVGGWNQDMCRDCLLHCLTDKALQYGAMSLKRQPQMPYRKLLANLERRFGAEELPAAAQAKFNQATQKKAETMEEWADRVQTMATEAFRELPETYCNQQTIARFCQGLYDTEAGHSVFMRGFHTLGEAMNEVRLYQHSRQAMGLHRKRGAPSASAMNYDDDDTVQVSAVQERSELATVKAELARVQRDLQEVLRSRGQNRSSRGRGRGGGASRESTCWRCGGKGHFQRNCPNKDLNSEGSAAGANPRPANKSNPPAPNPNQQ